MIDSEIKLLREKYPWGTGVRCIEMHDERAVPAGTIGRVTIVDDIGTIHVSWDNGSSLGLIPGEDRFETVVAVETRKCGQPRAYADSEYEYILTVYGGLTEAEVYHFCRRYTAYGRKKENAGVGDLAAYFAGWSSFEKIGDNKYRYYAYVPYAD